MSWKKKVKADLEKACPDCFRSIAPVAFECSHCKEKWNAVSAKEIQLAAELAAARDALKYYAETASTFWDDSTCPPRLRPTLGYGPYRAQQFFDKYPEKK